jgi:hypothetical protein
VAPTGDGASPHWPDDSAESAFLSEARERGEPVVPKVTSKESADDREAGPLPGLDELVERIPLEVREALDDLFRAKFTTVRRIPRQALKN